MNVLRAMAGLVALCMLPVASLHAAECFSAFGLETLMPNGVHWEVQIHKTEDVLNGVDLEVQDSSDEEVWHHVDTLDCPPDNGLTCTPTVALTNCYTAGRKFRLRGCSNEPVKAYSVERTPKALSADGVFRFKIFHSTHGWWTTYNLPSGEVATGGAFPGSATLVDQDESGLIGQASIGSTAGAGNIAIVARIRSCDTALQDNIVTLLPQGDLGCGESNSCCECVGDPVRLSNGNMRYTERDPLPSNPVFTLQRTYDSRLDTVTLDSAGVFGDGWTSALDSRLFVTSIVAAPGEMRFVSIRTETNDWAIFTYNFGDEAYEQSWPRVDAAHSTLTEESGTFVYWRPDQSLEHTYDATTGRLVQVRSIASGCAGSA